MNIFQVEILNTQHFREKSHFIYQWKFSIDVYAVTQQPACIAQTKPVATCFTYILIDFLCTSCRIDRI